MRKTKSCLYILSSLCFFLVAACSGPIETKKAGFELDHIVIFAPSTDAEDTLKQTVMTFGDKLTTEHLHQGTSGHYFVFYNTFIEFLYLDDTAAALRNESLFKSPYTQRWKTGNNICPFGFGLTLTPFDTAQTTFPLSPYFSLDSPEEEYYLMSDYNSRSGQPLIYVSPPNRAFQKVDSLSQIDQMFKGPVREDFRAYLTHPSGIKNLTKVVLTLPEGVKDGNAARLQKLQEVEIKKGDDYALTLIFDHGSQGKEMVLNAPFKLKIRY